MKIIVGLGNPGDKYKETRHNAGFMFLDKLACHKDMSVVGECANFNLEKKFESEIAEISANGQRLILAKPQTFMNLSGQAVRKILDFYKAEIKDIVVVYDDKDLPLGNVRVRESGSSGGHRGVQSIIEHLGTEDFKKIRLGIAPIGGDQDNTTNLRPGFDTTKYVLEKFDQREKEMIEQEISETVEYLIPFLNTDTELKSHSLTVTFDSL